MLIVRTIYLKQHESGYRTTLCTLMGTTRFENVLKVAASVLAARLAPDPQTAIALWKKAVEAQDALIYAGYGGGRGKSQSAHLHRAQDPRRHTEGSSLHRDGCRSGLS